MTTNDWLIFVQIVVTIFLAFFIPAKISGLVKTRDKKLNLIINDLKVLIKQLDDMDSLLEKNDSSKLITKNIEDIGNNIFLLSTLHREAKYLKKNLFFYKDIEDIKKNYQKKYKEKLTERIGVKKVKKSKKQFLKECRNVKNQLVQKVKKLIYKIDFS